MAKCAVFPDIENLDVLLLGHFIAWLRSSDFLVLGLSLIDPCLSNIA